MPIRTPHTPDIANRVATQLPSPVRTVLHRQLAWALLVILILLAGSLTVPPVRAALLEFLQIGSVRIQINEPTPTALATVSTTPVRAAAPTPTQRPTATPFSSLVDLMGEMSLAEAEDKVTFPIRLPNYPPELGAPDKVFYQVLGGPVVVLVWVEPNQPEQVRMSLHVLGQGAFVDKGQPHIITHTTVHDREAVWAEGPYLLSYRQGNGENWQLVRLVQGKVLIWYEEEVTYRLESNLSLDEAIRVAESLQP